MTRRLAALNSLVAALMVPSLVSCSGTADSGAEGEVDAATTGASASGTSPAEEPRVEIVEDLYDVGGHKLFMSCSGEGAVTVVQVHGWVNDTTFVPHAHMETVRDLLNRDYRVCLYDRRNVGSSETVDAVQTPADLIRDMERVLAAGGVEPPYILMAGSFGGLVAHAYLAQHPDDVIGMLLIDSMWPDELRLDRYLPRRFRFQHFDREDRCCTVERISQFDLIRSLQRTIGEEPDIPVVYLASEQEPRNQNNYESPAYDARVLDAQAEYVDSFSPGILRWVDAPHWMEPVVPDVIADAVREVDELAHR